MRLGGTISWLETVRAQEDGEKGRVVDVGHTTSVFAAPRHEHTKTLLAAAPRVDRGEPLRRLRVTQMALTTCAL